MTKIQRKIRHIICLTIIIAMHKIYFKQRFDDTSDLTPIGELFGALTAKHGHWGLGITKHHLHFYSLDVNSWNIYIFIRIILRPKCTWTQGESTHVSVFSFVPLTGLKAQFRKSPQSPTICFQSFSINSHKCLILEKRARL